MAKKINLDIQVLDRQLSRPIRGAMVTLKSNDVTKEVPAIDGKACFGELDAGLYHIRATASGYKDSVFSLGIKESSTFSVQLARSQLPF